VNYAYILVHIDLSSTVCMCISIHVPVHVFHYPFHYPLVVLDAQEFLDNILPASSSDASSEGQLQSMCD